MSEADSDIGSCYIAISRLVLSSTTEFLIRSEDVLCVYQKLLGGKCRLVRRDEAK